MVINSPIDSDNHVLTSTPSWHIERTMSDSFWSLQRLNCQSQLQILPPSIMLNLTQPDMREIDERWWVEGKVGMGLCISHDDTLIKLSFVSQGQTQCWNEFLTLETSVFLVHVITHGAQSAIFSLHRCSEGYSRETPDIWRRQRDSYPTLLPHPLTFHDSRQ